MFGIGMPELFVIMAIALIVIGPKKLPDLARSIGRALGEFKKATGELKSSLGVDEELSDVKHAFDDINQEIKDAVNVDPLTPSENKAEPADSTGNSPDKNETEDPNPEQPNQETTVEAGDAPDSESADIDTNTADIDTSTEFAVKKNNQGETAGDE